MRQLFAVAFVHSLNASAVSVNGAARWLRRRPATIRAWISGEHRIDFEAIARSPKLWSHFLRCLVILERKARRV